VPVTGASFLNWGKIQVVGQFDQQMIVAAFQQIGIQAFTENLVQKRVG
jgi:hypothetical protein